MSKAFVYAIIALIVGTTALSWSKSQGDRADELSLPSQTQTLSPMQLQSDTAALPEQKMDDMSFIFSKE